MAYDGRVLRRARERFEADRDRRRALLEQRRAVLYQARPRLREIDDALRAATGQVLAAALRRGADPMPELDRIRAENLRLQAEKRAVLRSLDQPEDCLDDIPACPLCGDTGWRNGRLCGGKGCLRAYYAREQQRELSNMLDLGNQSFETFSLDWYPARPDNSLNGMSCRENMEHVLHQCLRFVREFGRKHENLLLFGNPGLGKTFLSAAMAREVSGAGFSVVYDTASSIFARFESQKFTREEAAENDVGRILSCDLLILDDLGTELSTVFVQTALYRVVNTRLLERRSTIISTNLGWKDMELRYTPQTISRLRGEYEKLLFFGEDIRQLKRLRK